MDTSALLLFLLAAFAAGGYFGFWLAVLIFGRPEQSKERGDNLTDTGITGNEDQS